MPCGLVLHGRRRAARAVHVRPWRILPSVFPCCRGCELSGWPLLYWWQRRKRSLYLCCRRILSGRQRDCGGHILSCGVLLRGRLGSRGRVYGRRWQLVSRVFLDRRGRGVQRRVVVRRR